MKPGQPVGRWTLGAERKGTAELLEWEAEPAAEAVSPRGHVRLRPGAVDTFVSHVPPDLPGVARELWRGMIDGEPVCIRPRTRPARPGEGDLESILPLLDRFPALTEEDLRIDSAGRLVWALPGLPPNPGLAPVSNRARVERWFRSPPPTALAVPANANFVLVVPLAGLGPDVLAAIAAQAAADPSVLETAARRRESWAVGSAATKAEAQRLAERLARRGIPARIDPVEAPSPRFWPVMLLTGAAQLGFLLDGVAEQTVVLGLTGLGIGTLVRALRRLGPWMRAREAQRALTDARAGMAASGPARRIHTLIGRLGELPPAAQADLRDALQEAQDRLGEVDPAALDAALARVEAEWQRDGLAGAVRGLRGV